MLHPDADPARVRGHSRGGGATSFSRIEPLAGAIPVSATAELELEGLAIAEWPDRVRRQTHRESVMFADLFGTADPDGGVSLTLLLSLPDGGRWLALRDRIEAESTYPSLVAGGFPAAEWYEREMLGSLGIHPVGHPHPESLLRGAALASADMARFAPLPAGGHVVDFPLGPVRSGIVESGHYGIRTVGEEIVDLRLQLGFKHRGVEQMLAAVAWPLAPRVAERISGTDGVAHSMAAAGALERLLGVDVPLRARQLRSLFGELERLYNHAGYQADLCGATGLAVAQAQFDILKEQILRLAARIAGHRYLFGTIVVGGVADDLDDAALNDVRDTVRPVRDAFEALIDLVATSSSHQDRLQTTGRLTLEEATRYAVVGPVARASGLAVDARRDHPYAAYDALRPTLHVVDGGDAAARSQVRLEEGLASADLVLDLVEELRESAPLPALPSPASRTLPGGTVGFGWAEGARGTELHWVETDRAGAIGRYRVRSASFACWQAFARCVPGDNILTDFPIIEQSFGLSFAGSDR